MAVVELQLSVHAVVTSDAQSTGCLELATNEAERLFEAPTLRAAARDAYVMRAITQSCPFSPVSPPPQHGEIRLYRPTGRPDQQASGPSQPPQHNYRLEGSPLRDLSRSNGAVVGAHCVQLWREADGEVVMCLCKHDELQKNQQEQWQGVLRSSVVRVATRPGSGPGATAAAAAAAAEAVLDSAAEAGPGTEAVGAEVAAGPEVGAEEGAGAEVRVEVGHDVEAEAGAGAEEEVGAVELRAFQAWARALAAPKLEALAVVVAEAVAVVGPEVRAEVVGLFEVLEAGAWARALNMLAEAVAVAEVGTATEAQVQLWMHEARVWAAVAVRLGDLVAVGMGAREQMVVEAVPVMWLEAGAGPEVQAAIGSEAGPEAGEEAWMEAGDEAEAEAWGEAWEEAEAEAGEGEGKEAGVEAWEDQREEAGAEAREEAGEEEGMEAVVQGPEAVATGQAEEAGQGLLVEECELAAAAAVAACGSEGQAHAEAPAVEVQVVSTGLMPCQPCYWEGRKMVLGPGAPPLPPPLPPLPPHAPPPAAGLLPLKRPASPPAPEGQGSLGPAAPPGEHTSPRPTKSKPTGLADIFKLGFTWD